ncbi:MAG: hypothetical protein ACRC2H_09350 [Silanimonas sp.]
MPRLSFSGFDRADEAKARALFESLRLGDWSLSDEAGADAVLIDLDSMYGQMAWMKGLDVGKVSIGLTHALRADTAYRLDAPLAADTFRAVLNEVAEALRAAGRATPAAPDRSPTPRTTAEAPVLPVAAPAPVPAPTPVSTTRDAPAISAPMSATRLAARIARATGPFTVQFADLPRVVIDPTTQQFAPGKSLKALLGYATAELPADAVEALNAETAATALRQAGDLQPLSRLNWLLALGGGEGRVVTHAPGTRFQLGKWPQAEREFPKHFRIATVMLKSPATVSEIATASGASEAEVADYVNAALAVGHASAACAGVPPRRA